MTDLDYADYCRAVLDMVPPAMHDTFLPSPEDFYAQMER